MNLTKLVSKNIASHGRSYAVYFFSLVFSVMVYYSFMTLSHDAYLQRLLANNQELAGPFRSGGFFIVLFVVMFMFSATGFFIKNRQREIGLYLLLGMRKFQIGLIFFLESFLTGLASLGIGLLAGFIFTRLFALMLLKFLVIQTDSPFLFSLTALEQTIKMFLPILLVVSLRGMYVVYRYQLIQLFQGQQRSSHVEKPGILSWLLGVLGVGMLVYGYYQGFHFATYALSLEQNYNAGNGLFLAMILILFFCILGTYFIFKGFLPLVLVILTKSRRFYYRQMHMVTISNLQFHLKENARTLGTVAVLLGTALAALVGAAYFYIYSLERVDIDAPTELIVAKNEVEHLKTDRLKQVRELEVKVTGAYFPEENTSIYTGKGTVVSLVSVSQYDTFSATPPTNLAPVEGIILLPSQGQLMGSRPTEVYLATQTEPIQLKAIATDVFGGNRGTRYRIPVLVLADSVYEKMATPLSYGLVYFNSKTGEPELTSQTYREIVRDIPTRYYYLTHDYRWDKQQVIGSLKEIEQVDNQEVPEASYWRTIFFAKVPLLEGTRQTYGLIVYIAIFLGVVFLVATGSILTVKQLAEFSHGREHYQLLLKLGVSRKKIKVSVLWQNGVVFFSPLLIASLHSYFAIAALKSLINGKDYSLIWLLMLIFLAIYVLFFYFTARSCYRLVTKE